MKLFRILLAEVLVYASLCAPTHAQWQTPNHSVPVGRGAGVTGFGSAAPGPLGTLLRSNGSGVDPTFQALNAPVSLTGDVPINSGHCDQVLALSGGFKTVTLPAANAVPAGCTIRLKNNETYSGIGTGRGKKLANFPADVWPILYPQQAGSWISDGASNWYTFQNPGTWLIPTTVELCYRQDGDDTSDGLGNGAVAADCLAHVQKAVVTIGSRFNGGGYNACNIGVYNGGTNVLGEAVSQTGQSVGCYLTVNFRNTVAVTWSTAGACWSAGDNAIIILDFKLAPVILACNNTNLAFTCQFNGHQSVIFDWFGSGVQWNPQGTNDCFVYMDAYGRGTSGVTTIVVGTGAAASANSFAFCDSMCLGIQFSGTIAHSAGVTYDQYLRIQNGGYINWGAAATGAPTVTNPSKPVGYGRLITNGTTIPGGTTPAAACPPAQNASFGLVATNRTC